MPQISLYIDETTLKRAELAAKTERLSLSKCVSRKLRDSFDDEWPDHYDDLFGAISDDTFQIRSDPTGRAAARLFRHSVKPKRSQPPIIAPRLRKPLSFSERPERR